MAVGDDVEVAVTTFDAERRRIGLRLDRVLRRPPSRPVPVAASPAGAPDRERPNGSAMPEVGDTFTGTVTRVVPESDGAGGYILLRVPGLQRAVMLHCTSMTEDLRGDLRDGFVDMGEEIPVEVTKVDQRQGRVLVRDLPEPGNPAAGQPGSGAEVLAEAELTRQSAPMAAAGNSPRRPSPICWRPWDTGPGPGHLARTCRPSRSRTTVQRVTIRAGTSQEVVAHRQGSS